MADRDLDRHITDGDCEHKGPRNKKRGFDRFDWTEQPDETEEEDNDDE